MPDSTPPRFVSAMKRQRRRMAWFAALLVIALIPAGAYFWITPVRPTPIVVAFAGSITGPLSASGIEARAAAQLYFNEVNAAGGIDGHPLQLDGYNDESLPATAAKKAAWILDSPAVAVLGHTGSETSIGAAPVYREGGIAAVTGNAAADSLVRGNPDYFAAVSPASAQAAFLARYIQFVILRHTSGVLRAPDIDLVSGPGPEASGFADGFLNAGTGLSPAVFRMEASANAAALADRLAAEPEPRIIVLGLGPMDAAAALKAIRRRGIHSMVILAASAATDAFLHQFDAEPEERDEPGFFSANLFAIAPVILDNTGLLGRSLASRYRSGTGMTAGWYAAGAQDAARLLVDAIRRAHIGGTEASRSDDRRKIRDALAAIGDPAHAVAGINGALWFDAARQMPRPMQFGYFRDRHLSSAALQLVPVKDRDLIDVDQEIALGHVVRIGDGFFWLQRVVATGIDLARIERIDIKDGTFQADFWFWMRYASGDDQPGQVEFSDFTGSFDPAHPTRASTEDGIAYRLWRVSGTFRANFNLHDYPFDTQALVIRMHNRDHPREQIVYAIDTPGLRLDGSGRAAGDGDAFKELQLWRVVTVAPFVDSVSTQSTLGEPALLGTTNRTEYGGFAVAVLVKRNVLAFMVKALLPLFLLTLVVFATLFFPHSMAKERLTIPVTGILTSAVLLLSITNQLPALGYTVALEYIFYIFFILCLMAMVAGLLAEILRIGPLHRHVVKLDVAGRVLYLALVAITLAVFISKYGG